MRDQMADYARAERLRELRDATHLSREKVAGEIGVTTKTLYAWENGGGIAWKNAQKVAAFYGVEPESLVSRDLEPVADPVQWDDSAPAWAQQIIESQRELRTMLVVILAHFQLQEDHRRLDEAERSTQPPPAATQKKKAAA